MMKEYVVVFDVCLRDLLVFKFFFICICIGNSVKFERVCFSFNRVKEFVFNYLCIIYFFIRVINLEYILVV